MTDRLTDAELDAMHEAAAPTSDIRALIAEVREHRAPDKRYAPFNHIANIRATHPCHRAGTCDLCDLIAEVIELRAEMRAIRHADGCGWPLGGGCQCTCANRVEKAEAEVREHRAARTLSEEDDRWCEMVGDDTRALVGLPVGSIEAQLRDNLLSALAIIDRITEGPDRD